MLREIKTYNSNFKSTFLYFTEMKIDLFHKIGDEIVTENFRIKCIIPCLEKTF